MAYQGGNLKSTSINGVKMYTVTGQQRSLATWLPPKKLRDLRKDKDYLQRVDLIQDLRFETATTKIKATPDGEFLIASGIYPPQVKVYELRELSLKFERHLVSEIIDFQVLADDYSKLAFLCADRSVCLHAKYGSHYSLRIPRMGRDIAYDCWSCDLLCAASSPDLYRINLEQGRFLSPLNTQSPALNVVSQSKLHGLVACGGEDGAVECFDMRVRSSVGRINAVAPAGDIDQEVTALEFDGDGGYLMAVGSSAGNVLIYDLRSSYPIRVKDHMYGSPILDIKWHRTLNSERPKLITTDNHIVRIWDPETGEGMTSIEPTAGTINDICVFSDSGLMLLALDCSQIPSYFIPKTLLSLSTFHLSLYAFVYFLSLVLHRSEMAQVSTFRAVAMVVLVAIFSTAVSTVSAQDFEMAPAPSPAIGSAYSPAISGAVICSSLILSMLALMKH